MEEEDAECKAILIVLRYLLVTPGFCLLRGKERGGVGNPIPFSFICIFSCCVFPLTVLTVICDLQGNQGGMSKFAVELMA